MPEEATSDARLLSVSIAPLAPKLTEVRYYDSTSVSLLITNNAPTPLLVEQVILRFQSDASVASEFVEQNCGWELGVKELHDQQVTVSPTPIYLANTNMFDVMVKFRPIDRGVLQGQLSEIHHRSSYLIIREAESQCGKLFISFKQPEDLTLARLLEKFARRAGFEPYLAIHDSQPGTDLWKRIEPELRRSDSAAIIWTCHTEWGDGVQREVKLARQFGIPDVLLLEDRLDLPEEYRGTGIEYLRFDPHNPAPAFSKMLTARRQLQLKSEKAP
jgi:hypothetical protein